MSGLHAGRAVTVSGVTIIPIEKVYSGRHELRSRIWTWGFKEPMAVVVCDASGRRALDCLGGELPLSELMREVPGLEASIAQHTARQHTSRQHTARQHASR